MPQIDQIPVHDHCPTCDSTNYKWIVKCRIDPQYVVAECQKCLTTFCTTSSAFLSRKSLTSQREPGQEG